MIWYQNVPFSISLTLLSLPRNVPSKMTPTRNVPSKMSLKKMSLKKMSLKKMSSEDEEVSQVKLRRKRLRISVAETPPRNRKWFHVISIFLKDWILSIMIFNYLRIKWIVELFSLQRFASTEFHRKEKNLQELGIKAGASRLDETHSLDVNIVAVLQYDGSKDDLDLRIDFRYLNFIRFIKKIEIYAN